MNVVVRDIHGVTSLRQQLAHLGAELGKSAYFKASVCKSNYVMGQNLNAWRGLLLLRA